MIPFWLTSMNTRTASTSTPAPPATTSAAPDAGAPARPLAMTTMVATAAVSAAMMVAAAELEARRVQLASATRHGAAPSSSAATRASSWVATPGCPPRARWPTARASPTSTASRAR